MHVFTYIYRITNMYNKKFYPLSLFVGVGDCITGSAMVKCRIQTIITHGLLLQYTFFILFVIGALGNEIYIVSRDFFLLKLCLSQKPQLPVVYLRITFLYTFTCIYFIKIYINTKYIMCQFA